jgi:hypothetical protein
MALGTSEIVQFDNANVMEGAASAVFAGTLTPSSPRAVVLNFTTRDGTLAQFDSALAGEDYVSTTGNVRFGAGEAMQSLVVPLLNDAEPEETETFDVLLALDMRFPANNRAFVAGGSNGGTLAQLLATVTDDD